MNKVNVIGIGGQRCATTWMFKCLTEHPDVCNIDSKEINFFSDVYHRGYDWYEKHFSPCPAFKIKIDFSVSYLYDLQAPQRTYEYNPDMKIIACLREPISRALDQHLWHISLGLATGENVDFKNALKVNPMYIEQGLYFKYLKNWLEYFPLDEKTKVVLVDDIKKNPENVIKSIYDFLGVNHNFRPSILNREVNKAVIIKSPGFKRITREISYFTKKMGGRILINYLKRKNFDGAIEKLNTKAQNVSIIDIESETERKLQEIFQKENEKLSKLIQRDLLEWSR